MNVAQPASLLAIASLLACGSSASPSTAPSANLVNAPPGAAAPVASDSSSAIAPTQPHPPSPLHVLVTTDQDLRLFPLDGALFVAGSRILTRVDGDTLVRDEKYAQTNFGFGSVNTVVGSWPNSAYVIGTVAVMRTGAGVLAKWKNDHWEAGKALSMGVDYDAAWAWSDGRILAHTRTILPFLPPSSDFVVLGAGSAGIRSTPDPSLKCADMKDWHAFTDGSVFVVETSCEKPEGGDWPYFVERWAPGASKSASAKLSGSLATKRSGRAFIAGRSGSDAYVWFGGDEDGGRLQHFDGAVWKDEAPPPEALTTASVAKDGTLYGVSVSYKLFRRRPGAAWDEMTVPDLPAGKYVHKGVTDVVADERGDLWVTASGALLRERAPAGPPIAMEWPYDTQFAMGLDMPRAATKTCESLYALLYGFTKITPDDYDFPLTRKALKGRTEFASAEFVVTEDAGHKYFGAFLKDFDLGTRLVQRIHDEVKGSSPQLLCAKPRVVRKVEIDLATGEVAK